MAYKLALVSFPDHFAKKLCGNATSLALPPC